MTVTGVLSTLRCRGVCPCVVTARSVLPRCSSRRGWWRLLSRRLLFDSTPPPGLSLRGGGGVVGVVGREFFIRRDPPAGLVTARVAVKDGHAQSVTLENVPSYVDVLDAQIDVPGFGQVPYSMAFGGNFYAVVDLDAVGLPFDRARQHDILRAGLAIMDAINEQVPPRHPEIAGLDHCHHVEFIAPGSDARLSRHAMAIYPGWFDRSPCGTGTSARMAELWARGELGLHEDFTNESFIGSRFVGRLIAETTVADRPAVVPIITGRAWVTGMAQYLCDPSDPFPTGFQF